MNQVPVILWLFWLTSSVFVIQARVKSNGRDSHILLVEENDVRKLLVSASTNGNSSKPFSKQPAKKSNSTDEEEEKKTLAQQVADGKYGLIQTELFSKPAKRPGIISYDVNPEVPKDNINNLGGLQADEIWLAENHLLVLKGGGFRDREEENSTWKPIDNYVAPKRQVKIPPKPKVAPPFPIQLKDGGPVEFIEGDKNSFRPFGGPPFIPPNVNTNMSGPPPAFPYPFPPFGLPPPPPYPFSGNFSDLDEDDPRFYYPPPYDFVYEKDNSSHVAPGPLVPGIVLPPPADFFGPLSNTPKRPTQKPDKRLPNGGKNQKLNQIVNTSVPKRVSLTKQSVSGAPTVPTSVRPKENVVDKALPNRKEKEGRKNGDFERLPNTASFSKVVTRPPETTTKSPRLVTRPPDTTTPFHRINSRPLETTTTASKFKTPETIPGEWVPLLGTSLCPLTDPKCYDITSIKQDNRFNHISLLFNTTERPNDLVTRNPNVNSGTQNNDFPPIKNRARQHYYSTTVNPYYDLKPIIVPTTVTTASYKSVDSNRYDPRDTYYFYEEPVIRAAKLIISDYDTPEIRNRPSIIYVNHDVSPKYELNTASPLQVLRDQTVKKPQVKVKNKHSPLELFESELSTITNSNKFSIGYSVGSRQLDVNQISGYSYNVPLDDALDIFINNNQNNYKNKQNRGKEIKTPVFEYSFSAPGYGKNDSPKISSGIPSTEKPEESLRQNQFSYFGFDAKPIHSNPYHRERNTQSPSVYTSPKSKYRKVVIDQLSEFLATETPFTQIYTPQEPELLDDITKNYFTLFGKKINPDAYTKYVTTPIPPPVDDHGKNVYYDEVKTRQRQSKGPKRQNIRFPEESVVENFKNQKNQDYNVQNSNPNGNAVSSQAPVSKANGYNRYYNNYRNSYKQYYPRDYSLASDINVNYRKPYPAINPDAEYIDSDHIHGENPPSNSYISYQLPGNGGHFYFLTPQSVHATNYHLASSGVRSPPGYNRLYYKRNTQNDRNR